MQWDKKHEYDGAKGKLALVTGFYIPIAILIICYDIFAFNPKGGQDFLHPYGLNVGFQLVLIYFAWWLILDPILTMRKLRKQLCEVSKH